MVTVGSGLQAYNELRRYQAVLTRLGITGAYEDYKNLLTAIQRVQSSIFFPWSLPGRIKELKEASKKYMDAMLVITRSYLGLFEKQILSAEQRNEQDAELVEQKKVQKAELKALGLASAYWALIMLGSAVIFVAICISIVSDLNP